MEQTSSRGCVSLYPLCALFSSQCPLWHLAHSEGTQDVSTTSTTRVIGIFYPHSLLQMGKSHAKCMDPLLNDPTYGPVPHMVAQQVWVYAWLSFTGPAFSCYSLNLHSQSWTDSPKVPGLWQSSVPLPWKVSACFCLVYVCFFCFFLSHPNSWVF